MSLLRNRLSNRHAEVAAAFLHSQEDLRPHPEVAHSQGSAVDRHESNRFRILDNRGIAAVIDFGFDKEQRSALDLHPTDNDGPRAAFRVHREHVVAGAQFAEILGCARGQIDVGVDGARVHSKRTRGHVARLDRFGMDQEKAGRTVAHEHPLAAPQERARVDAHPVAEAEGTYRRDFARTRRTFCGNDSRRARTARTSSGEEGVKKMPSAPTSIVSKISFASAASWTSTSNRVPLPWKYAMRFSRGITFQGSSRTTTCLDRKSVV